VTVGSFQFALEEAKRRARMANLKRELPPEVNPQTAISAKVVNVNTTKENPRNHNKYAKLKPAKKRNFEETFTERRVLPMQRPDGSSLSSPPLTPTEKGSKRPFVPAKRPREHLR
jgi:hypothetical protein